MPAAASTGKHLKLNLGKYVSLAQEQDILITRNGKVAAKLVTAKPDKVAIMNDLFSMFPKGVDVDLDDFEDAVLAVCAKNADADCVVSRDKAFVQSRHSPIKVLMANALLKKISQHK